MRATLGLTMIVLLSIGSAVCGAGSPDLRDDKRLDAPVTLMRPMVTIEAVLREIATMSHVSLRADEAIREQTVVVCVNAQPCGELLSQLATSLDYTWETIRTKDSPASYRLFEGRDARARRAALARQHRRESSGELDLQLRLLSDFERKHRGAEPRDRRDEIQRIEAAVNELPTGNARAQAERELRAANASAEIELKPFWLAYLALPDSARDRLLGGERVVMATRRPGAVPMPAEVVQALREARQYQAVRTYRGAVKPVAAQTDDEFIDFLSEVKERNLTVTARSRWLPGQERRLRHAVPSFLATPSMTAHGPLGYALKPGKVSADKPELLRAPISFTWPGKKLNPEEPLTYFTGITVSEVIARLAVTDPRWRCVGDANLEGIQSVRTGAQPQPGSPNAFESPEIMLARFGESGRAGALPLGDFLSGLAERAGVDIHVASSGWLRFRSALYFETQPRQISAELLKEAYRPLIEGAAFTPEDGMRVARVLSYPQVSALGSDHLRFPRRLLGNGGLRHTMDNWRLLGALSAESRELLFAGAPVRVGSLSRGDQLAVRKYVEAVSSRPDGVPLDLELAPRDLSLLQFSLATPMGESRKLDLRLGSANPPIYTTWLAAKWNGD